MECRLKILCGLTELLGIFFFSGVVWFLILLLQICEQNRMVLKECVLTKTQSEVVPSSGYEPLYFFEAKTACKIRRQNLSNGDRDVQLDIRVHKTQAEIAQPRAEVGPTARSWQMSHAEIVGTVGLVRVSSGAPAINDRR